MGAMLVGIATSLPIMIFAVFYTVMQAAVVAFCAYKCGMSVKWWLFAAFVLNSFVLIPFAFALIKCTCAKCTACGAKVKYKSVLCPACGESIKRFDDEGFIRKIMIVVAVGFAVFELVNTIVVVLMQL